MKRDFKNILVAKSSLKVSEIGIDFTYLPALVG
jgi:hypothetical protein